MTKAPRPATSRADKLGLAATAGALACAAELKLGRELWDWDWGCIDRSRPWLVVLTVVGLITLPTSIAFSARAASRLLTSKVARLSRAGVFGMLGSAAMLAVFATQPWFGFPALEGLSIFGLHTYDCAGDREAAARNYLPGDPAHLTKDTMKNFGETNTYTN